MSTHDELLQELSTVLRSLPPEKCAEPRARVALVCIRHNVSVAREKPHHPLAPELLREALEWARALKSTTNPQSEASRGADDGTRLAE